MAHLKRLLAGSKSAKVHAKAGFHGLWTACAARFSPAWARADGASAPGKRWPAGRRWNLAGLLPGLKPPRTPVQPADGSNPAGGGHAGSRVSAARSGERLGRCPKSWWAFFQQLREQAVRSRALAKAASKSKAFATRLRQTDWRNRFNSRFNSRHIQLKSGTRYVVGWSRRCIDSWEAAIRRIPVLAGRIPGLTRSSRPLRHAVLRLGRRGWTNAISTWRVVVAKLSKYAMRRGLAMARNAGSKSPSLIYLGNQKDFLRVDPDCPFGYARQLWSAKAMDAYSIARGATDWNEEIQVEGDCPIGYVRQVMVDLSPAQAAPPPLQELADPSPRQVLVDPAPRQAEPADLHPESFLLILFDAYSKVVGNRADNIQDFAPVVPLVDVYAWMTSPQEPGRNYSKQEFTRDVYRLHASGVDTTEDGAKVSFPISRGVKGKTLTTTNETGGEVRYYGIRFLQRTPVAQS